MRRAWRRLYALTGHRGLFIMLLGAVQVLYGAGLLTAAGHDRHHEHWWPASTGSLGGFPLDFWGTVWVVIGGVCLLAGPSKADRAAYALGVLLNTGWAAFAVNQWISHGEAGAWAPAAIYTGIAVGVFLVSGWPDTPSAPLPDLDLLPPPPTPEELDRIRHLTDPPAPS